ncbi:MAG: tetratricopeptide repeat protein, partial [Terriglobales bacterium]
MGRSRRRPMPIFAPLLALALLTGAASQANLASLKAGAIDHFYNLEYPQAIAAFRQLARAKPDSAGAWNHLAQAELYQEMYRMGALESTLYGKGDEFLRRKLLPADPSAVAAIEHDLARAQTCAQAAIARSPNRAQSHYDLAVTWGLRGNLAFSVRKAYWQALSDAKNARRQAEIAHRLQPGWLDPMLIIGIQNYVAGSLPWSAKIFTTLIGYRGDKQLGIQQITEVALHGGHARTDAQVLLAVVDRRDGRNRAAAALFAGLARRYPRNVLFAVETGEAYEAAGEHA